MYNFRPGLHQSGELFDILSAAGYIADASGHVLKMAVGECMAALGRFQLSLCMDACADDCMLLAS